MLKSRETFPAGSGQEIAKRHDRFSDVKMPLLISETGRLKLSDEEK